MFGIKTSGSSDTRPGALERLAGGGSGSLGANVRETFKLAGVDDATMQSITDQLCTTTSQSLVSKGYQLATADFKANTHHTQFLNSTSTSGDTITVGKSQYRIFAPTSERVATGHVDSRGVVNWVWGALAEDESGILTEIHARAFKVIYIVDFAKIEAHENGGIAGKLFGQHEASVKGKPGFTVIGNFFMYDPAGLKCYEYGGRHMCTFASLSNDPNSVFGAPYIPKEAFQSGEVITDIADTTSNGEKLMNGATTALGILATMNGGRGYASSDAKVMTATVDEAQYKAKSVEGGASQLDAALGYYATAPLRGAQPK